MEYICLWKDVHNLINAPIIIRYDSISHITTHMKELNSRYSRSIKRIPLSCDSQEQAVDREHERDVFQQEILKLEQQLKNPQKLLAGSEQRTREVTLPQWGDH